MTVGRWEVRNGRREFLKFDDTFTGYRVPGAKRKRLEVGGGDSFAKEWLKPIVGIQTCKLPVVTELATSKLKISQSQLFFMKF
jgi:hypothetical protein